MKQQHRIHWKKGLDITPEIFIASDNYHITERHLLGRFLATKGYGILPENNFYIEKNIDNQRLSIQKIECLAISKDGYVINIQKDTSFQKELTLTEPTETELYVVLTVNPSPTTVDEKELYIYPEYNFIFKNTKETIEQGIPVLKIYKNHSYWEIDNHYIPPSFALNSLDTLKHKYIEIKDVINRIIEKIPENDTLYLPIIMLQLELNSYSLQKTPEELTLLMKKFCRIFQLYLKTAKEIEESYNMKKFMTEPYNHNEIEKVLRSGFENLFEIHRILDEKPEEIFEIKV